MTLPLIAFSIGLLIVLGIIPLLSKFVAPSLGLLDQPDNNRKLHKTAIPLVGGIAVFVAVLASAAAVYWIDHYQFGQILFKPGDFQQFMGLILGSGFLLLVGVVDDSVGLRGRQKLLGQIIAMGILIAFGFNVQKMTVWGTDLEFGVFSILIVMFWGLAVTNSVNLLDGADGFAATIGIVMSVAMTIMAISHPQGRLFDAVVISALAGALLGFLRYNFPPAKVFLGDAGSMLIGFVLAAISIRCAFKQATSYAFFAPIALLAIPFLDTAAAIVRRKLTGRSIYSVDRGHLHHSLAKKGFGPRVSLIWVALLCSTTAAGGTIAFLQQQAEYAVISIAIVMLVMVTGRLFGVAEVELVSNKALNIGKSLVKRNRNPGQDNVQQSTVQLQGHRNWKEVWQEFCEFADEHHLHLITFDINLPWIHESFHAKRKKTDIKKIENDEWYSEVPLIVDGRIFGRIELMASKSSKISHYETISNLLKLAENLEPILRQKADLEPVFSEDDSTAESQLNGELSSDSLEQDKTSATT